jgi:menaquinone-dependent protoporphyrinogen IX oxidase
LIRLTSCGNTKTIVETIPETLKESGIEVDLFDVKDLKKLGAKGYNFPVPGSPIRSGTTSFAIRRFFTQPNLIFVES